jgi:hypothetical protein
VWSSGSDGAKYIAPDGHFIGKIASAASLQPLLGPQYETLYMTGQHGRDLHPGARGGAPALKKLQHEVSGGQ